jgi:hypothetical protein
MNQVMKDGAFGQSTVTLRKFPFANPLFMRRAEFSRRCAKPARLGQVLGKSDIGSDLYVLIDGTGELAANCDALVRFRTEE